MSFFSRFSWWWVAGVFSIGFAVGGLLIGLLGGILYLQTSSDCIDLPSNDYGDSPEGYPTFYPPGREQIGSFPNSISAGGATAIVDCTTFWLGDAISGEADYEDSGDPDGGPNSAFGLNDDGDLDVGGGGVSAVFHGDPSRGPAELVLRLKLTSQSAANAVVNVLQDHNMNGAWEGLPGGGAEWVIANKVISIPAGTSYLDLEPIRYPVFNFMPECVWTRVAVTSQNPQIEEGSGLGWTGTGDLGTGEIEDYVIVTTNVNPRCSLP